MTRQAAALLAIVSLCACTDVTEIVVVVTSTAHLDTVTIRVESGGNEIFNGTENVATTPLPMSIGLTPSGDESAELVVDVVGRGAGALSIRRTARTRFAEGESLLLHVVLDPVCSGITCPTGQTCVGGACESDEVADLPPFDGMLPTQPDAGPPLDGGPDGGDGGRPCPNGILVEDVCFAEPWFDHAIGLEHMCTIFEVRTGVGQVYCRGGNGSGQLGVGDTMRRDSYVSVDGLDDGARLALGRTHSCAIAQGATVLCWGSNSMGQLGVDPGLTPSSTAPLQSLDAMGDPIAGATRLALGDTHTCAIGMGGQVLCWGANESGQLGNGTTTPSHVPQFVEGAMRFTRIAAGTSFSCGIVVSGAVYCWGTNALGQIAQTGMASSASPVTVPLPAGVEAADIAAGQAHACILSSAGQVFCWGDGRDGQVGHRASAANVPPTRAELDHEATMIAAGTQHTCALTAGMGVFCWGANGSGQLIGVVGIGTAAPMQVIDDLRGPTGVWAGGFTTCAWTNEGPLCAGRQPL